MFMANEKIENKVVAVSDYMNIRYLQEVLSSYANDGYRLVSTQFGDGLYNEHVMFLFFTK